MAFPTFILNARQILTGTIFQILMVNQDHLFLDHVSSFISLLCARLLNHVLTSYFMLLQQYAEETAAIFKSATNQLSVIASAMP